MLDDCQKCLMSTALKCCGKELNSRGSCFQTDKVQAPEGRVLWTCSPIRQSQFPIRNTVSPIHPQHAERRGTPHGAE